MTSDDRRYVAEQVTALATALRVTIDSAVLTAYWRALRTLDRTAFARGIERALETCERFPSAAELRRLSGVPSVSDRAQIAWEVVDIAISRHGAYRTVDFGDPATHSAVRSLGGWVWLCSQGADQLARFTRRDFVKAYEAYTHAGPDANSALPLRGLAELRNGQLDMHHDSQEPVRAQLRGRDACRALPQHSEDSDGD